MNAPDDQIAIEYKLFDFKRVKPTDCILILNNDDKTSAWVMNKIVSKFQFQHVDIYSFDPTRYANVFMYPCKPLTNSALQLHFKNMLIRQNADHTFRLTPEQNAHVQTLTNAQTRLDYVKGLQPMHHLPTNAFQGMSSSLIQRINHFLMIPQYALLIHHLFNQQNDTDVSQCWYKNKPLDKLMHMQMEHHSLRIVSATYSDPVPKGWFSELDLLFLFRIPLDSESMSHLHLLYNLHLTTVFYTFQILQQFMDNLKRNQALVILFPKSPMDPISICQRGLQTNDATLLSALCPIDMKRVRYTTYSSDSNDLVDDE